MLSRLYCRLVLGFLGRAFSALHRVDLELARDIRSFPEGHTSALAVYPHGPALILRRHGEGFTVVKAGLPRRRGLISDSADSVPCDLIFWIRGLGAALRLFTFAEGTCVAEARRRLTLEGSAAEACAFVRLLNAVETYLLPAPLARRAVKDPLRGPGFRRRRAALYAAALAGRAT